MPLRPEQHRQPKKEDIPPWPDNWQDQSRWLLTVYRRDIATLSGSTLSLSITYPLDTIKTNMQTDIKYTKSSHVVGKSKMSGFPTTQCCRDMMRRGGISEFYRGIGPPLLTVGLYRWLNMWAYRQGKYYADNFVKASTDISPLAIVNTVGSQPTLHTVTCFTTAGMFAGAFGSLYTSPMELIKYGQQLANKIAHEKSAQGLSVENQKLRDSYSGQRSLRGISKIIYRNFGWRGFYMGYKYHFIRDTIGGGTYFGMYEYVKHALGPQQGREAAHATTVFFAGGVCGAFSSAVMMPYDTAKSRYQKECLSQVERPKFPEWSYTRNFSTNFPGFGIVMARSALTHGIFFLVYESIKSHIERKYIPDLQA